MSKSIFSPSWYRVASLKPRLRNHAQIHRHFYRGQLWYVAQNHSTGKFHRFSPEAYYLIGLMDGRHALQQIWEMSAEQLGDDMPSQEEVINLLTQLHRADVLQSDILPETHELHERDVKQSRNLRWQKMRSPLAIRIPLLDPERFLHALSPFVTRFFGPFGMVLWLLAVSWAAFMAVSHWSELTENISDRVLSMDNLLLLWLVFPLIKAAHELGHGFAVKRWGGEVHEMGIMLLVLMPVPYVDASSASAFQSKYQRMMVGAAGILVESFIAAIAMAVWLNVEPGILRSISFNIMLIAGVSTVLFNGNPLLRFDGYYIFSDWLEIPNLGKRANDYLGYLIQRYPFGVKDAVSPVSARGERGWFVSYSLASFVYRTMVLVAIIWFIAGEYFFIGVLLAFWAGISTFVAPLFKQIKFLFNSPKIKKQRRRATIFSAVTVAALLAILIILPMPSGKVIEGVIWAPEKSLVRASAEGVIVELIASSGQQVHAGDVLVICEDPGLLAEVRVLEAQLVEFGARYDFERLQDRAQSQITRDDINRVRSMLMRAREREAALIVRSPGEGVFIVSDGDDMPGRFVRRGEVLAYVMDFSRPTARVVVEQDDVDLLQHWVANVEVRLSQRIEEVLPAVLLRQVPAASDVLPSAALGVSGGGVIAVRPDDPDMTKTFSKIFQFDLELAPEAAVDVIGERVFVRVMRDPEPLALQWYRSVRQLFLSRFNV